MEKAFKMYFWFR